jgi:hypothetical protein
MYKGTYNEEINAASDNLKRLIPVIVKIIEDLENNRSLPGSTTYRVSAYTRVYWLRRELSKIVKTLGSGQPELIQYVDGIYRKELESNENGSC